MGIVVALDFDGTIVEHNYPDIGKDIGAFDHLRDIQRELHIEYILWTVRDKRELNHAVWYCWARGIIFWGVNRNPTQHTWSESPKAHAHIFIDDAALGTPLIHPGPGIRPYVDWNIMGPMLRNEINFFRLNKASYYQREK